MTEVQVLPNYNVPIHVFQKKKRFINVFIVRKNVSNPLLMRPIAILLGPLSSLEKGNETLVMDAALRSKTLDITNQSLVSVTALLTCSLLSYGRTFAPLHTLPEDKRITGYRMTLKHLWIVSQRTKKRDCCEQFQAFNLK